MRVAVIGGTGFIGRAIVAELASAGHAVLVVHRGQREVEPAATTEHAHVERHDVAGWWQRSTASGRCPGRRHRADGPRRRRRPDGRTGRLTDAGAVEHRRLAGVRRAPRGRRVGPAPPGRARRDPLGPLPVPGPGPGHGRLREAGRRGAVPLARRDGHPPADGLRRARPAAPRGADPASATGGPDADPDQAGNWLCTRGYVGEMARGIRLALETDAARGEIFNLGEARTWTVRAWYEQIVAAAGARPRSSRSATTDSAARSRPGSTMRQHVLVDSSKAREMLGWVHADPSETVRRRYAGTWTPARRARIRTSRPTTLRSQRVGRVRVSPPSASRSGPRCGTARPPPATSAPAAAARRPRG